LLAQLSTTTGSGSDLVDLLIALRRVREGKVYRVAILLGLKVVGLRVIVDDVGQVLGVASVSRA